MEIQLLIAIHIYSTQIVICVFHSSLLTQNNKKDGRYPSLDR